MLGRRRELAALAPAAERVFVTVEEVRRKSLFADETDAAGALSGLYVERIALAPMGARPLGLGELYGADGEALRAYALAAKTQAGFDHWLAHALGHAVRA